MKIRIASTCLLVLAGLAGTARCDFIAKATLDGAQDGVNTPGTGNGTVTYVSASDELLVSLTFSNLSSPTNPVDSVGASHIHFGAPGVSGPIIFAFTDFPVGVESGSYTKTLTAANLTPDPADGINTFADAVAAIRAGETYFNIHTVTYPMGEIRGQILAVPEPAGVILLGTGAFGVVAVLGRRRRPA